MPTTQLPKQICSRPFGEDALSIVRKIIDDGQKEGIHRSESELSRERAHLFVFTLLAVPSGYRG